jgi:hypothetical protein
MLPRHPRSQGKSNMQSPGKIFVVKNAIKFTIVNEPLKRFLSQQFNHHFWHFEHTIKKT